MTTWTMTKPTSPGWYWLFRYIDREPVIQMCSIWEWWDKTEMFIKIREKGVDYSVQLALINGLWIGPLNPDSPATIPDPPLYVTEDIHPALTGAKDGI